MDLTMLLILGGIVIAIVMAGLWVLNRSWGNFPDRASTLLPPGSSALGMSRRPATPQLDTEIAFARLEQDEPPTGAAEPPPSLVPNENPMVHRAVEQALRRDSNIARYIVRDGDRLYFSFEQISNPTQRQAAYDLMRRFNAGEDVDIRALLRLVQQMVKS